MVKNTINTKSADPATIYIEVTGTRELKGQEPESLVLNQSLRSSPDWRADLGLIERALEFKYAARRKGRVLVVATVTPAKARLLRWLGVETGE